MQKTKINILSTRPVGKTLIHEAALHDIIIDEISFIKTEGSIDNTTEKKIEKISHENISAVFTSMNAVKAVKKFIPSGCSWKIFCIGNTTKKLVENIFGEKNIAGIADNALALADHIISSSEIKKVYFFCGNLRRNELPERLKNNNIEVEEIVVYRTIETSHQVSKRYNGILFFSPSGVQSFLLKNSIHPDTQLFAIGSTTADALKPFTQQHIITANMPDKEKLVERAINYFSKTQIY